jgi:hypothetical protein
VKAKTKTQKTKPTKAKQPKPLITRAQLVETFKAEVVDYREVAASCCGKPRGFVEVTFAWPDGSCWVDARAVDAFGLALGTADVVVGFLSDGSSCGLTVIAENVDVEGLRTLRAKRRGAK